MESRGECAVYSAGERRVRRYAGGELQVQRRDGHSPPERREGGKDGDEILVVRGGGGERADEKRVRGASGFGGRKNVKGVGSREQC